MGRSSLVGGLPAFTGDLALLVFVHGCESTFAATVAHLQILLGGPASMPARSRDLVGIVSDAPFVSGVAGRAQPRRAAENRGAASVPPVIRPCLSYHR